MGQSFNTVLTVNITLSEAGRDSTPTHTHAYTLHVNSWLNGLSYLIPPSLFLSSLFLSLALSSLSRFVYHRKMNNKCYGNIMSRPSFSPPPPTSSSSLPPFPHRPILLHHSSEAHLFSHQPLVGAPIHTAPHSRKENLLLFPFRSALLKSKRPNRRSIHVWMRWCWQSRLRPVGRQMHVWVNAHKHWLQDFTRTSSELTQRELCRYWENRNV